MKMDLRQQQLLKRTFVDFHQMSEFSRDPLILHRAQGLYYWDIHGRRYFDAIGGIFVATLGHGHPRLLEAMRKQMEKMTFAPPLHGIADVTLDFIERLGAVTPGNLKFIKPFSGGSESIEAAIWAITARPRAQCRRAARANARLSSSPRWRASLKCLRPLTIATRFRPGR